jgi:hypothetical protein
MKSRFIRAITSSLISFGHAAWHSPMLVQLPNPAALYGRTVNKAADAPASPDPTTRMVCFDLARGIATMYNAATGVTSKLATILPYTLGGFAVSHGPCADVARR